jgi:hypothetical protein
MAYCPASEQPWSRTASPSPQRLPWAGMFAQAVDGREALQIVALYVRPLINSGRKPQEMILPSSAHIDYMQIPSSLFQPSPSLAPLATAHDGKALLISITGKGGLPAGYEILELVERDARRLEAYLKGMLLFFSALSREVLAYLTGRTLNDALLTNISINPIYDRDICLQIVAYCAYVRYYLPKLGSSVSLEGKHRKCYWGLCLWINY